MEQRQLIINGERHTAYIIIERRSSVRASIVKEGINIRIPRHLSTFQREKEIATLIAWGTKKIEAKEHQTEFKKFYTHGGYLRTPHRLYRLCIEIRDSKRNFAKLINNEIIFKISKKYTETEKQKYISKQLRKLLAKHHGEELHVLVRYLNNLHFKKDVQKIGFKYTKSRWGVCKTATRDIEISTKLLLAPRPILEYVIIHELAHLIEPNHSRRFWKIVQSVDPAYKEKVKWLKKNGKLLEI